MKKSILLINFLVTVILAHAQFGPNGLDIDYSMDQISSGSRFVKTFVNKEETEGSPLLYNNWHNGMLKVKEDTVLHKIHLVYDIYNNKLYYPQGENTVTMNNDWLDGFFLETNEEGTYEEFANIAMDPSKKGKTKFMKVLYKGKTALYLEYVREFREADTEEAYSTNDHDEYVYNEIVYLQTRDGQYHKFRPKKKNFLKLLADKDNQLNKFISEEKLNMKNLKDVVKALEYYDSL